MKSPKVGANRAHVAARSHHASPAKTQTARKKTAPAPRASTNAAEQAAAAAALHHVARQVTAGAGSGSHVVSGVGRRAAPRALSVNGHASLQTEFRQNRMRAHLGGEVAEAAASKKNGAVSVTRTRERIIVNTRGGDDQIRIYRDRRSGGLVVRVNDERLAFDRKEASRLTIRAGEGDDRIFVGTGVHLNLTLEGGGGSDRIIGGDGNERIRGGAGRDYLNGSRGRDTLIGDGGNDVIYAGHGNDRVRGGRGDDYLEGGIGNDLIGGNQGRDIISGGRGNDRLSGASGTDRLYAGDGRDRLYDASGRDRISAQKRADTILAGGRRHQHVFYVELARVPGGRITIDGAVRFRERVQADLDFLRSSRAGQQMLRALERGAGRGNTITIEETAREYSTSEANDPSYRNSRTGRPGRGEDATVSFSPSDLSPISDDRWGEAPPIVWLYHEMVHGYNSVSGTTQRGTYRGPGLDGKERVSNDERQAVGLPVNDDGDKDTPMREINPPRLTENGLRHELGLPKRRRYS